MTTQGLRKTVQSLEAELNIKLYHSTREGVIITQGGRRVDAFYLETLPLAQRLEADLNRLRGSDRKVLHVGFSFGLFGLVYDTVLQTIEDNPSWCIDYTSLPERSLIQEMESGTFDFALTWGVPSSELLSYEHVTDIATYAVGRRGNPLVSNGPIRVADFDGKGFVTIGGFHKPHQLFMQACAAHGVEPGNTYETTEMPVTQAYLRQNLGIGLALAHERSAYDPEVFAFVSIEDFTLPVGLAYRQGVPLQPGLPRDFASALAARLIRVSNAS